MNGPGAPLDMRLEFGDRLKHSFGYSVFLPEMEHLLSQEPVDVVALGPAFQVEDVECHSPSQDHLCLPLTIRSAYRHDLHTFDDQCDRLGVLHQARQPPSCVNLTVFEDPRA